jgi:hypothetical protein
METTANLAADPPTGTNDTTKLTAAIIKQLYDDINTIISATNDVNLKAIDMGSMGKFPYNWHLNGNTNFNGATYDWLNKNITDGSNPVTSNGLFTNEYIKLINEISFKYSTQDSNALAAATANAADKAKSIIDEWKLTYGSLPQTATGQTPIDYITNFIVENWTTQSNVTLKQVQDAIDIDSLLDKVPASGQTILPVFIDYVSALGDAVGIIDMSSFNNGFIRKIKNAVLTASQSNGGIQRTDLPGKYSPAFNVSTTLDDISKSLQNTNSNNTVNLVMKMNTSSSSEQTVEVNGATYHGVDFGWLFDVAVGTDVNYYSDTIVKNSQKIEVTMQFTGVTLVEYDGPRPFDLVNNNGWYDANPILEAIKNKGADVSGYHLPDDFSSSTENLGFSTAVAIANYPTILVKVTTDDYKSMAAHLDTEEDYHASSMCGSDSRSSKVAYSGTISNVSDTEKSFTITMGLPEGSTFETGLDARAFVMGIQTSFPLQTNQ